MTEFLKSIKRPGCRLNPYYFFCSTANKQVMLPYESEENSYAKMLNQLIEEIGHAAVPSCYHDNEDCLAEYVRSNLNWHIEKIGGRWMGEDYAAILEQGGSYDINEQNLISAAAGRIRVAISRDQLHFDDMEQSHRKMLADVMAIILYHRTDRCNE